VITLDHVTKRFPTGATAVDDLSLTVGEGELVVFVGPSGCGKTTTMKMVNRLVDPTSGRILIAGRDVTQDDPVAVRRGIGYVIQQIGLFPHQTIGDNVATVPRLLGWDRARIRPGSASCSTWSGCRRRSTRSATRTSSPVASGSGRRRPRARRRPAGAADGRAVRRDRPGDPRPAAAGVSCVCRRSSARR
jgi:ABC-type sugar transport system ATPase subunit